MRPAPRHVTLLSGNARQCQDPRLRLFCLPHAGAGVAGYHPWRTGLPADVELALVHLPGRESRIGERSFRRMDRLVEHLEEVVGPLLDQPYAFFGHSFGAMVAYALTHRLTARGVRPPERLFVSGCRAPHLPDPRDDVDHMSDDELVEEIVRLGGTPPDVLQHKELMGLVLPVFRADLQLVASRGPAPSASLPCPVTALAGEDDPVAPPHMVEQWREHTQDFRLHVFPGGHFFVQSARDAVLRMLAEDLAGVGGQPPMGGSDGNDRPVHDGTASKRPR